jgi:pimeloyl-ACP methyl ester carboxylesterase
MKGWSTPLSLAFLPLVHGLARKLLLRQGAQLEQHWLQGIPINVYHVPARQGGVVGQFNRRLRGLTRMGAALFQRKEVDPPPLVLLHGIADNALTWVLMVPGLRRVGEIYAVDLPGFGLSGYPQGRRYSPISEQVAVVRQLLQEVVGRPALLVGNSMGGWVGARLAQSNPELVRGVIMLNPGGAMLDGRASWEAFVQTVGVADFRTVRAIYRQMFGRPNPALYLGQSSFQALFRRDSVTQFVAAADEAQFFRPEELRNLQVPIGLVWGMADHFLPAGSFEFFRDNLPHARILSLRGCGHLPQQERPQAVVRFVRRFVVNIWQDEQRRTKAQARRWNFRRKQ